MLVLSSDMPGGTERINREMKLVEEGQVDIVIGTQLVAKGHNFPLMTLVGVVDADLGLANGDPRAAERTFQLLAQVTGRAGRIHGKGKGLLQTYNRSSQSSERCSREMPRNSTLRKSSLVKTPDYRHSDGSQH